MKFKPQIIALLITLVMFIIAALLLPVLPPPITLELISEVIMLLVCFFIMLHIEYLKKHPKVYWILLTGAMLSYFGFFLDLAEEFFDETIYDISDIEDIVQTTGFVTLFLGIQYWVSLHTRLMNKLKVVADSDHLTGLLNRRAFYHIMSRKGELRQLKQGAFLILDLDHFKQVNDTYGHACGDHVIKMTAHALQTKVRAGDLLVRWGGEEFLLFLANCNEQHALEVASKLQQHVEQLSYDFEGVLLEVTVSIGVYHAKDTQYLEESISYADEALYKAKANGRNCVVVYHH